VLGAVGAGESEIERGGVRAQHRRQQLQRGAHLAVPVGRRLHDLGVQADGGVVDEHPVADQAQIDPPLHRRPEGVQRAHHVVAVQPEVHGQVVAGPGGDADERHLVAHGDAGDQRLRAVPAGHADHVGAPGHRLLGEPDQVVARGQHHRLDAPPAGLLHQAEPLHLAAARLGVHQQDRPPRRPHRGPGSGTALERPDVTAQRIPGRPAGNGQQHNQEDQLQQPPVQHQQQQRRRQRHHRHHRGDQPARPGPGDRVGGRGERQPQAHDRQYQPQQVPRQRHHHDRHGGDQRRQRHHRAHPARQGHRLHIRPPHRP
jgi:hypothetical protein